MLRATASKLQAKGFQFKHNAGYELRSWGQMKRTRVRVQHLLAYERIEVDHKEANKAMRYTDALLNICKKGPKNEEGQPCLSVLPPRFETDNHRLPFDAQNYKPEDFSWKLGAEFWGYIWGGRAK